MATPCPNAAHMQEFACKDKANCWEPCGDMGNSDKHARVIPMVESLTTQKKPYWLYLYVCLQWPFIIVGTVAAFVWHGINLGWYAGNHNQRKAERRVYED